MWPSACRVMDLHFQLAWQPFVGLWYSSRLSYWPHMLVLVQFPHWLHLHSHQKKIELILILLFWMFNKVHVFLSLFFFNSLQSRNFINIMIPIISKRFYRSWNDFLISFDLHWCMRETQKSFYNNLRIVTAGRSSSHIQVHQRTSWWLLIYI